MSGYPVLKEGQSVVQAAKVAIGTWKGEDLKRGKNEIKSRSKPELSSPYISEESLSKIKPEAKGGLTLDLAKEIFSYDRNTGDLIRIIKTGPNCTLGPIRTADSNGYYKVEFNYKKYLVHRVVWLLEFGYFPENQIDHINRDRTDNRVCNLRQVSPQCNARNCSLRKDNTSGFRGIRWNSTKSRWVVTISKRKENGLCRTTQVGSSEDFTEAVALRLAVEQCMGWPGCHSFTEAFVYIERHVKGD